MARITVTHRHGLTFDIHIRGYALLSDEPVALGGEDQGPTPTELMVAGLAACAADEAMKRLTEIGMAYQQLAVDADFAWDLKSERVASVRLMVTLPTGLSEAAREIVRVAMLTCPARKMLEQPPNVEYDFNESSSSAPSDV